LLAMTALLGMTAAYKRKRQYSSFPALPEMTPREGGDPC
jgi:hypothetical protein